MFSHVLRKLWLFGGCRPRTPCAGGLSWHVLLAGEKLFGPNGPDLAAWLAGGTTELVKKGPQRTVYRVRLRGGTVFVKRCRINTPRAWLRELLRPAKARLEFEN